MDGERRGMKKEGGQGKMEDGWRVDDRGKRKMWGDQEGRMERRGKMEGE